MVKRPSVPSSESLAALLGDGDGLADGLSVALGAGLSVVAPLAAGDGAVTVDEGTGEFGDPQAATTIAIASVAGPSRVSRRKAPAYVTAGPYHTPRKRTLRGARMGARPPRRRLDGEREGT